MDTISLLKDALILGKGLAYVAVGTENQTLIANYFADKGCTHLTAGEIILKLKATFGKNYRLVSHIEISQLVQLYGNSDIGLMVSDMQNVDFSTSVFSSYQNILNWVYFTTEKYAKNKSGFLTLVTGKDMLQMNAIKNMHSAWALWERFSQNNVFSIVDGNLHRYQVITIKPRLSVPRHFEWIEVQ